MFSFSNFVLKSSFQERTENKTYNQIIQRTSTQYLFKHSLYLFIIILLTTVCIPVQYIILTPENGLKVGFEQALVWQAVRL